MKLAWKYVQFYRLRSMVFVGILSLTFALPFISEKISQSLGDNVNRRTDSTPVLITTRRGKIRQTLNSLFFVGNHDEHELPYGKVEEISEESGLMIPMLIRHTTKQGPLVATEIDYFYFRDSEVAEGNLFAIPGDIVIGSLVAESFGVKIGDQVKLQSNDIYDITKSAPLKLTVTGILAPTGSPDDHALFTSLKTIWILEGFLHSHADQDPYKEESEEGATTYSKSLPIKQEITEDNLLDFHYHSSIEELPVTHMVFQGDSHKDEVLLMDAVNLDGDLMAFRPRDAMEGVVNIILRVEQFIKTYHLFWSLCTLMMIAMIFGLIIQYRKEEFSILISLGASKNLLVLNITQLIAIYTGLATVFAVIWFYSVNYLLKAYLP